MEGIVARLEREMALDYDMDEFRRDIAALISDWRKRGEARDSARAELDALGASHKDLAHRLARMGEELEGARERLEDMRRANAAMEAERDTARALLKDTAIFLRRNSDSWLDEDETNGFTVRIDKELGPTETKGEQHENNV